jgi:hypothetical protein
VASRTVDDFLSESIGIGKVVGFLKGFASEPADVKAGFVAVVKTSLSPFFRSRASPLIQLDVPYPHPA